MFEWKKNINSTDFLLKKICGIFFFFFCRQRIAARKRLVRRYNNMTSVFLLLVLCSNTPPGAIVYGELDESKMEKILPCAVFRIFRIYWITRRVKSQHKYTTAALLYFITKFDMYRRWVSRVFRDISHNCG